MVAADDSKSGETASTDEIIRQHYNTDAPNFAYICGGLRRIAVNPADKRAKMQLLRHGLRYFSKMQAITFIINHIAKPDVYFDVGVNYGECLFAHPLHSSSVIVGFEANPSLMPLIQRSRIYNDDLANVELVAKAVSDVPGQVIPFFVNKAWSGKSTGVAPSRARADIQRIEVETTSLDAEFSNLRDWSTAVIKVDVEGFEPNVIRGGRDLFKERGKNIIIMLEFDSAFIAESGGDAEEFFDLLQDIFDVYLILRRSVWKIDSLDVVRDLSPGQSKIHCDLMLVRTDDPDWAASTLGSFTARPLVDMAKELWGLPRKGD